MFKRCSCGVEWGTQAEFHQYTEFVGYMMGLRLANCKRCGTTVAVEQYPGSRDEFIRRLKQKMGEERHGKKQGIELDPLER